MRRMLLDIAGKSVIDPDSVSTMGHCVKLTALKASDFGYFGATWWPCATFERLKVTTLLATWVCL